MNEHEGCAYDDSICECICFLRTEGKYFIRCVMCECVIISATHKERNRNILCYCSVLRKQKY